MKNPNGFGSVIKLGGNRRKPYAVRITTGWNIDGKQQFKYISYHEKQQDAIIALSEYNKAPFDVSASKMTFQQVYDLWSKDKFKHLSKSSITGYTQAYKRCEPLYKKLFKNLRTAHLQEIIDMEDTPALNKKIKTFFNQLYSYAKSNDFVIKDYSEFVVIKTNKIATKKQLFTASEIQNLWDNVDNVQHLDIILILLYTGMRIGELLDIKTENVFLDKKYMIGGLKTAAGINRTIPIHDKILPLIKKRYNPKNKTLITSHSGNELKYANFSMNYWKDFSNYFELHHTAHDTRHTFISKCELLNMNKLIVKRIVGHSDKDITSHYTQIPAERLIEEINILEY